MLDFLILDTGKNPSVSIVWLHGLGADGHDFESIIPELKLPSNLSVRFVFPHAPKMAVTINDGYVMRAWYDIYGQNILADEDEKGIRNSEKLMVELIENEKNRGIASERIVLAGFSQGGAMALFSGLRFPEKLAGLMVLSAYLPLPRTLFAEMHAANQNTPIFMAHGRQDQVVPFEGAKLSKEFLTKVGMKVEWHEYTMPHSLCPQEIIDISAWLQKVLSCK